MNNKNSNIKKLVDSNIIWMSIIYSAAHGFIIGLGGAVFWDDWAYYGAKPLDIINEFKQAGSFLNYAAWIHIGLLNGVGAYFYKGATFLCFYFSGLIFYWVLMRDAKLDKEIAFWVAILHMIVPMNIARVAAIDFIYTLSVFFFMIGWWCMRQSKIISLVFFSLAFNTQSLLLLYAVPIILLYINDRHYWDFVDFLKKKIALLMLPFIWYGLKLYFFSPFGIYAGYNQGLSHLHILPAVENQFDDFVRFMQNDFFTLRDLTNKTLLAALVFILLRCRGGVININLYKFVYMFSFGSLLLLFGLIPYWILGHVPTFWEWTSRHQLLMPFGCSVVLVSLLGLFPFRIRELFFSAMVSLSILFNAANYSDLYKDWEKQKSLVRLISESEDVRNAALIIFDDKTHNAIRRSYRFYEWNGILNQAFPNEAVRFGLPIDQIKIYEAGQLDTHLNRFHTSRNFIKKDAANSILIEISEVDGQFKIASKSWVGI